MGRSVTPRTLLGTLAVVALVCVNSHARAQTFPAQSAWEPLRCGAGMSVDIARDRAGVSGAKDIVGDATSPALFTSSDGAFLYLRMRLSASPLDGSGVFLPHAWGWELDTNGNLQDYELQLVLDGAMPTVLQLYRNDVMAQVGNPADPAETLLGTQPVATAVRVDAATTSFDGDPDFFLSVAFPIPDLVTAGLTGVAAPAWAATSLSGRNLGGDAACHDGTQGLPDLPLMVAGPAPVDRVRDSDGDTVPDYVEQGVDPATDFDGDGIRDTADLDDDNDGVATAMECPAGVCPDTNNNGRTNRVDADDDGDSIPTVVERQAPPDVDGDGIPNHLDLDADGDGKLDSVEKQADLDGDGILNWVDRNDGDGPTGDADGDTLDNTAERALGTNPLVADSDGDGLSDGVEVGRAGLANKYEAGSETNPLDADTDRGGENDGEEIARGSNPLLRSDDARGRDDLDGDGLVAAKEHALGTDPRRRDTDGDGVDDGVELASGAPGAFDGAGDTLPDNADTDSGGTSDGDERTRLTNARLAQDDGTPTADLDADGLDNAAERTLGTRPDLWDSDGDGLSDGQEVARRTNPLNADTDGGGESDGAEANLGRDPLVAGDDVAEADPDNDGLEADAETRLGTNPRLRDTDGDGLSDSAEISYRTNPAVVDSDGGGQGDGAEVAAGHDPQNSSDDVGGAPSSSGIPLPSSGIFPGEPAFIDQDGDGYDDRLNASGGCVGCSGGQPGDGTALFAAGVLLLALHRRRKTTLALALSVFAVSVGWAGGANAEEQVLSAQRFQPAMDSKGLARTNSGGLLGHLEFDVGIWGGYDRNPVVLRNPSKGSLGVLGNEGPLAPWSPSRQRVTSLVGQRLSSQLHASVGLFKWVELSMGIPVVLYQERGEGFSQAPVASEPLHQFALGDIQLGGKIRLLRQDTQFVDLALVPQLTLPIGLGFRAVSFDRQPGSLPTPQPDIGTSRWAQGFTSEGFPTFQPELALSKDFYGIFVGGNAGLRIRRPYEVARVTVTQEALMRAGIGFKGRALEEKVSWMRYLPIELGLEAAGSLSLNHPYLTVPYVTPSASKTAVELRNPPLFSLFNNSAELGATAGLDLSGVHPYVGASVGVLPGLGTPDYRVYGGLRASLPVGDWFKRKPEPDVDGDGIPDARDACPQLEGDAAHKGCPPPIPTDVDNDGIFSDVDACPDAAEDVDGVDDTDGCPDLDNDADGVPDTEDVCPMEPGPAPGCPAAPERAALPPIVPLQVQDGDGDSVPDSDDLCRTGPEAVEDVDGFQDQDGCAEPDNDQDGVPDKKDNCPLEAETINGNEDLDGCPDEGLSKVSLASDRIVADEDVFFQPGKATIQQRSVDQILQVAALIKSLPHAYFRVEGHTDDEGSAQYNLDLSQRRAEAVRAIIIKAGVEPGRVTAVGFGKERPIGDNATQVGRGLNRRVDFVIVEPTDLPGSAP